MSNEMLQDDGQEQEGVIADINRGAPFKQAALGYLRAGWFPFPLKPMAKEPWATGVTGRKNAFPGADVPSAEGGGPGGQLEAAQIGEWLAEAPRRANIGLWLREDVIGIDVDAYDGRSGSETLAVLEESLGKLPATWISSARKDSISGIRFFRIPEEWAGKLQWSGKAGKNIDIIQTGHRFAGVWPSWNPDAQEMYQWYKPGSNPDGNPDRNFDVQVQDGLLRLNQLQYFPKVEDLPELPAKWIEHLTRGYIERTLKPIDMESTGREIEAWAKKFKPSREVERNGKRVRVSCREVESRLAKAKERIEDDSASHGQLVNGHWSLLNCGIEGHIGVLLAVKKFERFWSKDVLEEREKRGLGEAKNELYRSRIEALRKIKGRADEIEESGGSWQGTFCGCPDPTVSLDPPAEGFLKVDSTARDPDKYDMTDDGNAEHFTDIMGDRIAWVPGFKMWMVWDGAKWERDSEGAIARRAWWTVRDRQKNFLLSLNNKAEEILQANGGDTNAADYKKAKAKIADWIRFSRRSGNNEGANNAMEATKVRPGVIIHAEKLDRNWRLLGVGNGILELNDSGYVLRKAERNDLVTLNTEVDFLDDDQLRHAGGNIARGREEWNRYLDLFLPDPKLRHFVQKVFGYAILGGNPSKLGVFLVGTNDTGKSTILESVMAAMGQYAGNVDLAMFAEKKGDAGGPSPEVLDIMDKRIITASEAGAKRFNADIFKQMTGNDLMSGRAMRSDIIVRRRPAFVPIIATNSAPNMPGADTAVKRRLLIIPFKTQVPKDKDRAEAQGDLALFGKEAILHWLAEGWNMYAVERLRPDSWPLQVHDEIDDFVHDLSYELAFIHECIVKTKPDSAKTLGEQSVPVMDVFQHYCAWLSRSGSDNSRRAEYSTWTKTMKANGFEGANVKINGKATKSYKYIQLKELDEIRGPIRVKHA